MASSRAESARETWSARNGDLTRPKDLAWWNESGIPPTIRQGLLGRTVYAEETPYQKIEVLEHDLLGRVLILDGIVQTTARDEYYYHEMLVQVPLLGSPAECSRVLIIGGGDGGCLRQVLVHDFVERVDVVEIDERVVEVAREWIGCHGDYSDPRVRLEIADAAEFLAANKSERAWDLILIDATDPIGPGEVLYSRAFLDDVRRSLSPPGVVARHLGVAHLQPELLAEGVRALREAVGSCEVYRAAVPTYIGGDMVFAVAGGGSCREPRRAWQGRYYNPGIHRAAFALPTWWREACSACS